MARKGGTLGLAVTGALVALVIWGYYVGTAGGANSFDLQNVPMFRDCGKSGPDYTAADTVNLQTCSWRILKTETLKTAGAGLKARGRFLLLRLQLKNSGATEGVLTGVEVELIDTENISRIYDPQDGETVLEALGRESILKGAVGPGQTITGWVAFDVAASTKDVKLRVRDIDVTKSSAASIDLTI